MKTETIAMWLIGSGSLLIVVSLVFGREQSADDLYVRGPYDSGGGDDSGGGGGD